MQRFKEAPVPTKSFADVFPGRAFVYNGQLYMKTHLARATAELMAEAGDENNMRITGGYNAVNLESGKPGSFKDTTRIEMKPNAVVFEESIRGEK